jgi:hypothetical protein
MGFFLNLRDDDSFHTLIIKKSVGNYSYLVALGYEGGRTYGEFYSKLKYDENFGITGVYSLSTGSGEWEQKLLSTKLNQNTNLFETEKEELYEFMDENDSKIQNQILNEISKYVYWGYDEETDQEYYDPILKDIDFSGLIKINELNQYKSEDWNYNFLEITNSMIWALSFHFPGIINKYLYK